MISDEYFIFRDKRHKKNALYLVFGLVFVQNSLLSDRRTGSFSALPFHAPILEPNFNLIQQENVELTQVGKIIEIHWDFFFRLTCRSVRSRATAISYRRSRVK